MNVDVIAAVITVRKPIPTIITSAATNRPDSLVGSRSPYLDALDGRPLLWSRRPGALRRRVPLRTGLARFRASGSSKPL